MAQVRWDFIKEVVIALLVAVVGASIARFNDIPSRVSVLESQVSDIKEGQKDIQSTVHTIDSFLRGHR